MVGSRSLRAIFLADDPVIGESLPDQVTHDDFGGAVGLCNRIEIAAIGLVVGADLTPKEGQNYLTGDFRKTSSE